MTDTTFTDSVTLTDDSWFNDINDGLYKGIGISGLSAVASATTPDIFAATVSGAISYSGTTTCTGFVAAPKAGARRTLLCTGAAPFTAGANMLIAGVGSGSTFTAVAGQKIEILAVTTTLFYISPLPCVPTTLTNSLSGDVTLNNTAAFFTGPTIAQGTSGTWIVTGTVTMLDTGGAANFVATINDSSVNYASGTATSSSASAQVTISLSCVVTNPAGNLTILVKDSSATTGKIIYNQSGASKDSTITAVRIG